MTNVMSTPSVNQEDLRLEEVKQMLSGILLSDSILNLFESSVTRNIRVVQNIFMFVYFMVAIRLI